MTTWVLLLLSVVGGAPAETPWVEVDTKHECVVAQRVAALGGIATRCVKKEIET